VPSYRQAIEAGWLEGGVTLGAQLFDQPGGVLLDQDYSRGFLETDVAPGESGEVEIAMRAPTAPGRYRVRLDPVCEYVCWFSTEGSSPYEAELLVRPA
jgi:hypothetical protein